MADEILQPDPAAYPYGQFRKLPSAAGIPAFPDTFIGARDKAYHDFHARDRIRLRGIDGFYYTKVAAARRVDNPDGTPLSITERAKNDALARRSHAGMALYGEDVIIGERLDSVRREIQPDWSYASPILVRGLPYEVEHQYSAGDRGGTYVRALRFDLARASCESEWHLEPMPGDVIHLPDLFALESEKDNGYFDVKDVNTDDSRVGATGFFVVYKLSLTRTSRYPAERKLPPSKTTSAAELKEKADEARQPDSR